MKALKEGNLIILVIIILFSGCKKDSSSSNINNGCYQGVPSSSSNLLALGTIQIAIPPYTYSSDSGKNTSYSSQGDNYWALLSNCGGGGGSCGCVSAGCYQDTFSSTPVLCSAIPTNCNAIIGIFDTEPTSTIVNGKPSIAQDLSGIVWIWTDTMLTSSRGRLAYTRGHRFANNSIISGPPAPLTIGQTYWWAIWGFDSDGNIVASSNILPFYVMNK